METNEAVDFAKEKLRIGRIRELKLALDRFNLAAPNTYNMWTVLFTDKQKRVVKTAIQNEIERLQNDD